MSLLKHIILSVVVLFATTDNTFAQSYNIVPKDTVDITGFFEDLETLTISQLNTTSDSLHLKWKKVSTSVPLNWEATICDNSLCNTSLVDTGTMNPVLPGETGFLLVHITAHLNEGIAVIRYAVWDTNFPSNKDTLTFIMRVRNTTAIEETIAQNKVLITPNPVNYILHISVASTNGFQMQLNDSNGKNIYQEKTNESSINLSTASFPSGNYYLTTTVNNQRITQKIFILH